MVAADSNVDVRRHVDEMRRLRRDRAEPVGRRERPLGSRARVDRVDEEVIEPGMIGMRPQRALEPIRDDTDLARRRAALLVPPVGAGRDHRGLGVENEDVDVLGVGVGQGPHARGVDDVEGMGLRRPRAAAHARRRQRRRGRRRARHRLGTIAIDQRVDECSVARACSFGMAERPDEMAARIAQVAAFDVVDVRTRRFRDTPRTQDAARVDGERGLVRTRRFLVVEGVALKHAAREQALRHRVGRRRHRDRAEAIELRCAGAAVDGQGCRARAEKDGGAGRQDSDGQRVRAAHGDLR